MSNVGKNISELSKGKVTFVEEFLGKQLKAVMKLEASITVNGMVQASSIMDNLSTFLCSLVTKIEWDGKEIELIPESIEKWTDEITAEDYGKLVTFAVKTMKKLGESVSKKA